MALCLKPGVRISKLTPPMALGNQVVHCVYSEHSYPCIITSGEDGRHSPKSLHYSGNALDYRTKNIVSIKEKMRVLAVCRERLGKNYDVLLECLNRPNEHLHVEYDPPGGK